MSEKIYPVQKPVQSQSTHRQGQSTRNGTRRASKNPDKFWGKHGKRIDWFKPYTKVKNTSFDGKVSIKWFEDGLTNVSYNCIDRHLKTHGQPDAIIWEGDNPYDRQEDHL
jgi:acetyl-CoA synthetase